MNIVTDILKEIPLAGVLRERLHEAESEMGIKNQAIAKLKRENAKLRNFVKEKDATIRRLENQRKRTPVLPKLESWVMHGLKR